MFKEKLFSIISFIFVLLTIVAIGLIFSATLILPVNNKDIFSSTDEGKIFSDNPTITPTLTLEPVSIAVAQPLAVVRPNSAITFQPVITNNLATNVIVALKAQAYPTTTQLGNLQITPSLNILSAYQVITVELPITTGALFSGTANVFVIGNAFLDINTPWITSTVVLTVSTGSSEVIMPLVMREYAPPTPTSTPTSTSTPTPTLTPTSTPTSTPSPCPNRVDDMSNPSAGFAFACEVRVGETLTGTINVSPFNKLDFYSTTLRGDLPYTFTLINTSNFGDLDLYLYPDPPNYNVYLNRSINNGTETEVMVFTPTLSAKFYLMVYGYDVPSDVYFSISVMDR